PDQGGQDHYEMFPLCVKLLNVQDASPAQVKCNKKLIYIFKVNSLQAHAGDERQIINLFFSKQENDARKE
ncbi:hypothetical protein L0F63_007023, partial [Massospora cicadina]